MRIAADAHPARDRVTFRFLTAPKDAASLGLSVSAGRVLEWVDEAGYACAAGWAQGHCVTAYVGDAHFTEPIQIGDIVQVHAKIIYTGRTSLHVLVRVEAGDVHDRNYALAMHCVLVFVAVDEHGSPRRVPAWAATSVVDLELQQLASERVTSRRAIQDAMASQRYTSAGTVPETAFRFLASPSDVNRQGTVRGGTVMRWVDEVGHACAAEWSSPRAVAVYAGGIQFHTPIRTGDVVELRARLIHVTRRSMHLSVLVRAALPGGTPVLTARSMTIFADVQGGRAQPVRPLRLLSDEDFRLDAHAQDLMRLRRLIAPLPHTARAAHTG